MLNCVFRVNSTVECVGVCANLSKFDAFHMWASVDLQQQLHYNISHNGKMQATNEHKIVLYEEMKKIVRPVSRAGANTPAKQLYAFGFVL